MVKSIIIALLILIAINISAQQEDQHVWKVVDAADGSKFWYDASALDTIKGDRFNIWILQAFQPPKKYEGIDGEVFRAKTLYAINLTTVKYGILKVRYFDVNNQEIFRFDYDNPLPPESIRYPYPVTDRSMLFYLIEELYGPESKNSQTMKQENN